MSAQPKLSVAELLASLSEEEREEALAGFSEAQAQALLYDWRFWARPSQIIPGTPGAAISQTDWRFWLCNAGRGWGKTKVGGETTREWGEDPDARILMVAPTASDVREVMIEGPSGLMSCYPPDRRPIYNPSRHLVSFPSGAIGITRSADEPERLRGPQFTKFWADELCSWRFLDEAWAQLQFGFRLPGEALQGIITTTPKPVKVLKWLAAHKKSVVTRGSSYENISNISPEFYADVIAPYEGTRLGRQEIYAEILEDVPGALWKMAQIDASRIAFHEVRWDAIIRTVVAVDPAVTNTKTSDETGIVVVGLTRGGHAVVFEDLTCKESAAGWARVAINAYRKYSADRVVGEVNNGGDLVEMALRAADPNVSYRDVRATKNKTRRAEPVASLYEQGRVHHVGRFPLMEEQMCSYVHGSESSPDRMDALVWAITELLIDPEKQTVRQVLNPLGDYRIAAV